MAKRDNPQAPYYVQMRELERRLITGAIEHVGVGDFEKRLQVAAALLGVSPRYVRVRARILGGVYPGEDKNEPPAISTEVWRTRGKLKPKLTIVKAAKPDA